MNNLTKALNTLAEKEGLFASSPSYMYFTRSRSLDKYFHTIKKINHNGAMRYVSGIYRYLKSKKQWRLLRSSLAGNAKKKDAIARARKMKDRDIAGENKCCNCNSKAVTNTKSPTNQWVWVCGLCKKAFEKGRYHA